jgi:hypothetical protein
LRPASATVTSPRNTDSTTRIFSSGDFFDGLAIAAPISQAQTRT